MKVEGVADTKEKSITSHSLRELISQYQLSNQAEGKSPRTVRWYSEMLGAMAGYLEAKYGSCSLATFNIDAIRGYILYLRQKLKFEGHPYTPAQAKPISPKTVQCHVRALKAFSSWLYSEGYTSDNRLKNLKLPKAPATVMEPLTPDETRKIVASINKKAPTGARNHAIVVTLLDTGLRVSEAASITLNNLNLEAGYIKIMGKGAKERIVPFGRYVQTILWSYIDKVRPEPASPDYNNLFLSRSGKPITVNTIKLLFSRLARNSGIERLHAHLCRDTFAINYLLNGGDIFSLREILGHTTLDMVNHYLHFTSSQITAQHHKYSPMDRLNDYREQTQAQHLI